MQATTQRPPLIGMNLDALTKVVLSGGMQKFVAKQLAEWLYKKKVTRFDEMVNISKKNREWLEANYVTGREAPLSRQKSADGTVKYIFDVGSGNDIESVYIPDHDRATLCVSSQAGCKMNCYFCATGRLGFRAQLTAAQIINQVLSIPPAPKPGETPATELTNVVFMGMGEPLDNIDALLTVIEIMTAPWGMAWSPKRITVSTVGKLPQLKDLLEKTQVHVAVSLHTADPMQRDQLMPAQRAFPISSVIKMLEAYDFSHQRRLSFEYIMWRGVNDDIAHADLLIRLIRGLDCRVNLIRFHVIPGVELHPSSDERMLMFRNYLNSKGVTATIRSSRGEDIMAACGMLAGKNKK